MDRLEARLITSQIADSLRGWGKETGYLVTPAGGSFNAGSFTLKLKIRKPEEEEGAEAKTFAKYAALFGMKPEDFGKTFGFRGAIYKITGLNPRSEKFPVNAIRVSDGKPFKFPSTVTHL